MNQRARIPGWLLFVIATAFALSSTMQAYWLDHLKHDSGMPDELLHLLALNFLYWYIPALLAPVIMGAAIREQLRRQRWRMQVLVHIGGALAYSIVHTAAMMVLRAALLARTGLPQNFPGWWNYTLMQYLTQLDWLLMTYLFLVGLAHALAYRRESEARALRRRAARNAAGRGAAPGAAAAAAPALPVQHAQHDLRADAHRRRRPPTR